MTKYSIQFTRLVCFICIHTAYLRQLETVDILMKKAKPLKEDTYLCSAYAVNKADSYIVKFEALADADIVHHILLYGCPGDADDKRQDIWQCPPVCKDGIPKILFAWARNADPIYLPEGVGFHVGQLTMVKTIVLQAHYAKAFHEDDQSDSSGIRLHITDERQPKVAGVFLMLNYNFTVPPHQQRYHVDIACTISSLFLSFEMHPFAFRTHTHSFGKVVAGYHHNDTGFHLIGKGNPQWPQTFYPTLSDIRIRSGDKLVARCTFDSTDVDKSVHVGPNGSDEMCNFYFMFSTDSSVSDPDSICANVSPDNIDLLREIPADSDVPLPPNPALDQAAMGHHHHHHGMPGHVDNIAESSQSAVHDVDHVKDISFVQHASDPQSNEFYLKSFLYAQKDLPLIANERLMVRPLHKSMLVGDITHGDILPSYPTSGKDFLEYIQNRPSVLLRHSNEFGNTGNIMSHPDPNKEFLVYARDIANGHDDDIHISKRISGEYYEDYEANDKREQGSFADSSYMLSRNRNKVFDTANRQLNGFRHYRFSQSQSLRPTLPGLGLNANTNGHTASPYSPSNSGDGKSSEPAFGHLMYNKSWSLPHDVIGQVAGLATDHDGNLYVFHRGSRKWDSHSFDKKNNFLRQDEPIREEVIIIFSRDGKTISKFGSQQYFMPHGMHVDGDGNIWLTDVAMHQVFRIPVNSTTPNLILGEKFIHGSDERHFCKPTDVAVLASGEFFVSDGYCNHRVMKFSKDGVFLMQFGENNLQDGTDAGVDMRLTVPHSLTLAPDKQLLFLADREHGRIVCFNFEGATQYVIEYGQFGSRVFAVDYCPSHGGLLYAVNGPSYDGDTSTLVQGFTLRVTTTGHQLQNTWNLPSDRGFQSPHDVVSATTDQAVYVGELSPAAVWKFSAKPMEDSNVSGKGSSPSLLSESSSPLKPVIDVMSVKNSVKSNTTTNDTRHSTHGSDSGRKKSLFEVSFIIGIMLAVPVILLLIISIGMRLHRRGWCPGVQNVSSDKVFSLQHILGSSHKGFNKLSQEDSDEDGDDLNDSDYNEEYRKPMIG